MQYDIKAIALSGGGGLGAYQAGVMKAFSEKGVLRDVQCFSGTSVGALNAVLFSIGDMELAEYVWKNWVEPVGMLGNIEITSSGLHSSRETLREILKSADLTRLKHSAPVYVCAYDTGLKRGEYFCLNDKAESEMIDILLASSAISVVYEQVRINGRVFKDGGSSQTSPLDNHPVEIIYKKGFRDILLIPLSHTFDGHDIRPWSGTVSIDMYERFPDAFISILKPSCNIGGVPGIVDFRPESVRMRMALGYMDGVDFFRRDKESEIPEGEPERIISELAQKYIKTSEDLDCFIALRKHKIVNIACPTLGGYWWYRDIFELEGARIQWHCMVPVADKLLKRHYRILDRNNERRAYYFDPDKFIEDLVLFGEQKKFQCRNY